MWESAPTVALSVAIPAVAVNLSPVLRAIPSWGDSKTCDAWDLADLREMEIDSGRSKCQANMMEDAVKLIPMIGYMNGK